VCVYVCYAYILITSTTQVMGGINSDMFKYFKILMLKGFMAARKHNDKFIQLVEIMQPGESQP